MTEPHSPPSNNQQIGRRPAWHAVPGNVGTGLRSIIPHVMAGMTFIAGGILLVSGATPVLPERVTWAQKLVPLPLMECSHFTGSIIGVLLLLLARGLQLRLDVAFHMSRLLLVTGICVSLLKGADYEAALALSLIVVLLQSTQVQFYRKASFFTQRYTGRWLVAIGVVILCTAWIGLFAYRYVEYTGELWWRFAFRADVSRFLRAGIGVSSTVLLFALARLMHGGVRVSITTRPPSPAMIKPIIQQSSRTESNLALLGDKQILFNAERTAFIMYAVERNTWIGLGDPVGPEEYWESLIWDFRELCDQHAGVPAFYHVDARNLFYYVDLGFHFIKVGEEARVFLPSFTLEGSARRELRHVHTKLTKSDCSFAVIPSDTTAEVLPRLRHISEVWLSTKHATEKKFSLGFFDEDYLRNFPIAVVRQHGTIVAFANLWIVDNKAELSADLMRYLPDQAPAAVMDYLFTRLMLWGKEQGYGWFNLGMAPLAGLERHPLASRWNRIGLFVARYGEHFYNFEGLRYYKSKYDPVWRPKYLACAGGLALPRVLTNLTQLVGGSLPDAVRHRAA